MPIFNKVANTAAVLSLASCVIESGAKGVKTAKADSKTEVAIKNIRDLTGDSKLNKSSGKYKAMKEIVRSSDFTAPIYGAKGAITGFCRGAFHGIKNNILSIPFAAMTLVCKGKIGKTIGIAGLGISMAWDFIKNGTNLFTDKSTIEK